MGDVKLYVQNNPSYCVGLPPYDFQGKQEIG